MHPKGPAQRRSGTQSNTPGAANPAGDADRTNEPRPIGPDSGTADAGAPATDDLYDRVAGILAGFEPYIAGHGGRIELAGVSPDGIVKLRLRGACAGCPSSFMTLQMGIERALREQLPEVRAVEAV